MQEKCNMLYPYSASRSLASHIVPVLCSTLCIFCCTVRTCAAVLKKSYPPSSASNVQNNGRVPTHSPTPSLRRWGGDGGGEVHRAHVCDVHDNLAAGWHLGGCQDIRRRRHQTGTHALLFRSPPFFLAKTLRVYQKGSFVPLFVGVFHPILRVCSILSPRVWCLLARGRQCANARQVSLALSVAAAYESSAHMWRLPLVHVFWMFSFFSRWRASQKSTKNEKKHLSTVESHTSFQPLPPLALPRHDHDDTSTLRTHLPTTPARRAG